MELELNDIRKKIDKIDLEILKLFKKRFQLALMTKGLKKKVSAPTREKQVISNVAKKAKQLGLNTTFVKLIFNITISESKRIQRS
ncbi:MAG: chorismate mutase [bacterium]